MSASTTVNANNALLAVFNFYSQELSAANQREQALRDLTSQLQTQLAQAFKPNTTVTFTAEHPVVLKVRALLGIAGSYELPFEVRSLLKELFDALDVMEPPGDAARSG